MRDNGLDKTDRKADAELAKKAVTETAAMPFFRVGVAPIYFIRDPKPKRE